MGVRLSHGVDIVLEVFHAEVVFQNLILGLVVLALQARAVFCHVDDRSAVAVRDPLHELAEANGMRTEPGRLCLRANWCAILVFEEELEVAGEVFGVCFGGNVLDVVGTVVVPESVSPSMLTNWVIGKAYIP